MTFNRIWVIARGVIMANIIPEEERRKIKEKLVNLGFDLLRKGGIKAVNIDVLTEQCYIAKGTFYNLFPSKTEFLYAIMRRKREQTREKLKDFLSDNGQLSRQGLYDYLQWLCAENPNIFSYLNEQETRWLISKWPTEYLENENNDEKTALGIISYLESPNPIPDWQLFCNLLKLAAWTLNSREFLIAEAYQHTIDILLNNACDCICKI